MTLPLPYVLGTDEDPIQGNFDAVKQQFPLSRKHMKLETPHVVGSGGSEPAFENSWVNYDTLVFYGVRYWKDHAGMVHVEGAVKNGVIGNTVFQLPEGYRPENGLPFPTTTNTGHGELRVAATGHVVAQSGGTGYFALNFSFRQEQ